MGTHPFPATNGKSKPPDYFIIPSVAIIGSTPVLEIRKPMITPLIRPTDVPSSITTSGCKPGKELTVIDEIIPDRASVAPIERSMPLVIMTNIIPTLNILRMAVFVTKSLMFSSVKKLLLFNCTIMERTMMKVSKPSSRNFAILAPNVFLSPAGLNVLFSIT
jgi:hypothetical protein